MRRAWVVFAILAVTSSGALAKTLTAQDVTALRALSSSYVQGWLQNDQHAVMSVMAHDAVFIPHDGVQPRIGYDAISEFWFPNGSAVGRVPAYTQTITSITGENGHATLYGRFDLTWENETTRYNWIGNFMIVARRAKGRWLVTHMMANDADPKVEPITNAG